MPSCLCHITLMDTPSSLLPLAPCSNTFASLQPVGAAETGAASELQPCKCSCLRAQTGKISPSSNFSDGTLAHTEQNLCTHRMEPMHRPHGTRAHTAQNPCTHRTEPIHTPHGTHAHTLGNPCKHRTEPMHRPHGTHAHTARNPGFRGK